MPGLGQPKLAQRLFVGFFVVAGKPNPSGIWFWLGLFGETDVEPNRLFCGTDSVLGLPPIFPVNLLISHRDLYNAISSSARLLCHVDKLSTGITESVFLGPGECTVDKLSTDLDKLSTAVPGPGENVKNSCRTASTAARCAIVVALVSR